jgi:DNA-binding NarL/FixJ family response regulator
VARPPARVRVAIANDYPVVVRGLAAIVATYADRLELVELDVRTPPLGQADVVLYDDFASTVELGAYIAAARAKVVVFSPRNDLGAVRSALDQGAAGYLFKGIGEERLVAGLEATYAGERVVELARDVDDQPAPGEWPGRERELSARESEILALICQGLTNQQIAESLFLSVNSIKTYIRTLYKKIHAERRSQAVAFGIENGFAVRRPSVAFPSSTGPAGVTQVPEKA